MRSKLGRGIAICIFLEFVSSLAWGAELSDQGLVLMKKDGSAVVAPALGFTVEILKAGMIAKTGMIQYFDNPSKETLDGTYAFSLPEDAVVDSVTLILGNHWVDGAFQEKYEARQTFETAKQRGVRAALIERQESGAFTTSVANLGPGESAQVSLGFKQVVRWEEGHFSLTVPWQITVDTEADWDKDLDLGKYWTPEGAEPGSLSPKQADDLLAAQSELDPHHRQVTDDTSLVIVDEATTSETTDNEAAPGVVFLSSSRDIILSYQESMPAEIRCLGLSGARAVLESDPPARDPWDVLLDLPGLGPPPN